MLGLELGKKFATGCEHNVVIAVGVENNLRGFIDPSKVYTERMTELGLTQNLHDWPLHARQHMHEHRTIVEEIAKVAVKNLANGDR